MRERPIEPIIAALRCLGVDAATVNDDGCPPVVVRASGLRGGHAVVGSELSSQYLSGLLLAAAHAGGPVVLTVPGELASEPYVAMTLAMLHRWGIRVETTASAGSRQYRVPAPQAVRGRRYDVEPDASAASYFLAAAAITGGLVAVEGLGHGSLQGDVRFARVLEDAGCAVQIERDRMELRGTPRLRGVDVDMNDISDTVMTLAAVVPFAASPSRIRNVAHIRTKECDRIGALVAELARVGIHTIAHEDGLTIHPGRPHGAVIQTYDDHRMAMSFALLGLRVPGIAIADPECVSKTFPGYFAEMDRLLGRA
jgi:3-phosphoshikimate 1-carboxyvinyltransferase